MEPVQGDNRGPQRLGRSFLGWVEYDSEQAIGRMAGPANQLAPATVLNSTTEYTGGIDSAIDADGKATVLYDQEHISGRRDVFLRQMRPDGTAIGAGHQLVSDGVESAYLNDDGENLRQVAVSSDGFATVGYSQTQPGCCRSETLLRTVTPEGTPGPVQQLSPVKKPKRK
ncbi:MAG: hypothetical protein M3Y45_06250 [Actinomycetota bacterium]|nr:hypothetical protein [Actinomycetota bacterium]